MFIVEECGVRAGSQAERNTQSGLKVGQPWVWRIYGQLDRQFVCMLSAPVSISLPLSPSDENSERLTLTIIRDPAA